MSLNPANVRVDIEERLAYKTQLHGLQWMRACQLTETDVPQKIIFVIFLTKRDNKFVKLFIIACTKTGVDSYLC